MFLSSDGGATWTQKCTQCKGGGNPLFTLGRGATATQMRSIAGQAGTFMITDGQNDPSKDLFYITTNSGGTWSQVNGTIGVVVSGWKAC